MENVQAQDEPQVEAAPQKIKAMRRQPCPCGSGKVFKNCHEGDPGYEVATDASQAVAAPVSSENRGKLSAGPRGFQGPTKGATSAARNTGVSRRRKV